jgi:hypothetical protein
MAFKFNYLTQHPYDTQPLKTSYISNSKDLSYLRYLAGEEARAAWLIRQLNNRTLKPLTVAQLRSNLLSEISELICTCMAFKDPAGKFLTTNSLRYWQVFTWDKAIPRCLEISKQGYPVSGLVGSLASYALLPDFNFSVNDSDEIIVRKLIELFWADLGLNTTTPVVERIDSLLSNLNFDLQYIKQSQAALIQYSQTKLPIFRREALDETTFKDLPLRLLLGEFTNSLISVWSQFQIKVNTDYTQAVLYNQPIAGYQKPFYLMQLGMTIGRGGGWALLFHVAALESLLEAYDALAPYQNFSVENLLRDPISIAARSKVATAYSQAADYYSLLTVFNSIQDAKTTSQAWWLDSVNWQATLPSNFEFDLSSRPTNLIASLLDAR